MNFDAWVAHLQRSRKAKAAGKVRRSQLALKEIKNTPVCKYPELNTSKELSLKCPRRYP
jgi:hypothetical protein